nr:hypothetical protein [Tanacetum cinerariifolium]
NQFEYIHIRANEKTFTMTESPSIL